MTWHLITGEYPPQPGGVSDYTSSLARELAAIGDEVHVWAPACAEPELSEPGVNTHRLPGHFGPRALATLSHELNQYRGPRRLLVQYVPHAFGWKALNLPFCLWLFSRRQDPVWVVFHEVAVSLSWRQSLALNCLGSVNHCMAWMIARGAKRIFVSIPEWERKLRPFVRQNRPVMWLPMPSSIPVVEDSAGTSAIKARYVPAGSLLIGHFGTHGQLITGLLERLLPILLRGHSGQSVVLIGRGSMAFREQFLRKHVDLAAQVHASGPLSPDDVSRHLSACDVMIQPYPDGVSSRRTSTMVGLSHGRPIVTTTGPSTEPIWKESGAVALAAVDDAEAFVEATQRLVNDRIERKRLGAAAQLLYQRRFDMKHTIAALRAPS